MIKVGIDIGNSKISSIVCDIKTDGSKKILSLKTFGFSNIRFLSLLSISSFFLGVIILLAFNPVTSLMVKYYEDIKGSYDLDKSHLASITNNGVWIKEEIGSKINFIKSTTLIRQNFLCLFLCSFK